MSTQRIGFIGTGVMGSGMIRNLQKAGYPVNINTRTKAKAEKLIQEGCRWFDSQAELAAQSDVVITMVGYPQDVEAVYFGEHGVFRGKQGGFVIDMTTSSPSLAKRIYTQAKKSGHRSLGCTRFRRRHRRPSRDTGHMAGGEEAAFEAMKPIFSAMGQTLTYFGPAGSGQYAKMSNQIAIASNMMGVCEAMAYAKKKRPRPGKSHRHPFRRSRRLLVPGESGTAHAARRYETRFLHQALPQRHAHRYRIGRRNGTGPARTALSRKNSTTSWPTKAWKTAGPRPCSSGMTTNKELPHGQSCHPLLSAGL